jgi:hypothetical protein
VAKSAVSKLERPFLSGLIDTLVGSRILSFSSIPHRNRLAVLLLDSAFETACRAYLRYVAGIKLEESHKHRENLVKAARAKLSGIDDIVWETINFNYEEIRNDLYHQTSAKTITDESLLAYRESVEFVIDVAFGVDSSTMAESAYEKFKQTNDANLKASAMSPSSMMIASLENKVDKLVVAVGKLSPSTYKEVNQFFKKEGDASRLTSVEFTNIVARHTGSKRLFYYNDETKHWQLSSLGRFKLNQIEEESRNE